MAVVSFKQAFRDYHLGDAPPDGPGATWFRVGESRVWVRLTHKVLNNLPLCGNIEVAPQGWGAMVSVRAAHPYGHKLMTFACPARCIPKDVRPHLTLGA